MWFMQDAPALLFILEQIARPAPWRLQQAHSLARGGRDRLPSARLPVPDLPLQLAAGGGGGHGHDRAGLGHGLAQPPRQREDIRKEKARGEEVGLDLRRSLEV
jgi:hypothetical protein